MHGIVRKREREKTMIYNHELKKVKSRLWDAHQDQVIYVIGDFLPKEDQQAYS